MTPTTRKAIISLSHADDVSEAFREACRNELGDLTPEDRRPSFATFKEAFDTLPEGSHVVLVAGAPCTIEKAQPQWITEPPQ